MSYGYLVENFAYANDGANMIPVGHTEGVNIHNISSQLGLGMEYNISTNISFNLEPVFKYYVTPISNLQGHFTNLIPWVSFRAVFQILKTFVFTLCFTSPRRNIFVSFAVS